MNNETKVVKTRKKAGGRIVGTPNKVTAQAREAIAMFVDDHSGSDLHRFGWLPDSLIGELPKEWNVLIGEQTNKNAKIAHYTLGIPEFDYYQNCDFSKQWFNTKSRMMNGLIKMRETVNG